MEMQLNEWRASLVDTFGRVPPNTLSANAER